MPQYYNATGGILGQQQPQQGSGGILGSLESAAPTIGSVIGGIGGTILGGPLGGIAGAGAGGAIGQGLDNLGQGKAVFQGNDLTSGAEGAVGQGLGEGVGTILGKIGGSATTQALTDKATASFLKDQLGTHSIPHGINQDQVVQTLMDNGVTDLRKVPSIFGQLTGKAGVNGSDMGGILNTGTESLVQGAENNGTKIFGNYSDQTAKDATSGSQGANFLNDSSRGAAQDYINTQLKNAGLLKEAMGGGKKLPSQLTPNIEGANPTDVHQAYKNLRDAVRQQPVEGNGKATGQAYAKVADQLGNDLFNHPDTALSPEQRDGMIANLQASLGKSYPKLVANQTKILSKATTAQDLNNAQQELVDAIRAAQSAPNKLGTMTAGGLVKKAIAPAIGLGVGGVPGALGGLGIDALTGTEGGAALSAGAISKLPGVLSAAGSKGAVGTLGALGAGASAGASQAEGKTSSGDNSSITGGTNVADNNSSSGGGAGELANGAPATSANLVTQLDAMISADPLQAASLAPLLQQVMAKTQAINAAQAALQQYQQTLGNAGGGQGPIGGLLAKLGGYFGGPANQLGPEAQATQQAMSAAGAPGVQLPGVMSTAGAANAGIGQAQSMLGALGSQ